MTDQNLVADFLMAFYALPDIVKALWLVGPPAFLLAILTLWLRNGRSQMPEEQILHALQRMDIRPIEPKSPLPIKAERADVVTTDAQKVA
ncbi:hypothetical protein ACFSE1_15520 [Rhizobium helianthi]|uniref:Uncharacterized protein n=1 Tax=Rhizobium helianthi TaxID=1132695 RepID=A0ABW4M5Z5_9HYPH